MVEPKKSRGVQKKILLKKILTFSPSLDKICYDCYREFNLILRFVKIKCHLDLKLIYSEKKRFFLL